MTERTYLQPANAVDAALDGGRDLDALEDDERDLDVLLLEGRELPADFVPPEARRYRKVAPVNAWPAPYSGRVLTPEGDMEFVVGDYIVTDEPPTHAWPVRREVFEATYAPEDDEPEKTAGGDCCPDKEATDDPRT